MTPEALRAAARVLAERSCAEQRIAVKVTDTATVAAVCVLLTGRAGRGRSARQRGTAAGG